MKIYVHEKFDHRKHLPRELWDYREDAMYLMHLIYQHGHLRYASTSRKDRTVNLMYDYLTKVIDGRRFSAIRAALEEGKWIKCDHKSTVGSKSFTYVLGSKALKGSFPQVALQKEKLIKKISNWKKERERELTPTMKHIVKKTSQITLDENVAEEVVLEGGLRSRQTLTEQFTFIRNETWIKTPCDAGRLYTNITSLRSDGRNALRVNGSNLHNVDVSDSQFLALIILIENAFHGRRLDYIKSSFVSMADSDPLLGVNPFTLVPCYPNSPAFVPKVELFPLITKSTRKKGRKKREKEQHVCHTTSIKWSNTSIQGAKSDENSILDLRDSEYLLFKDLIQRGKLKDYVSKQLRTSRNSTKRDFNEMGVWTIRT